MEKLCPAFLDSLDGRLEPTSLRKQPGSPITELLSVHVFLSAKKTGMDQEH